MKGKLQRRVISIGGPTASGKSDIAIELAKQFNGVVLNADSRQVYRELRIGTAQPIPDTVENDGSWLIDGIKHYLYGHRSFLQKYTLYDFLSEAKSAVEKIPQDKNVFIIGGSGLYMDALLEGYELLQDKSRYSREFLNSLSLGELQKLVGENGTDLNESDRANPRRLIRAIEKEGERPGRKPFLKSLYILTTLDKSTVVDRVSSRTDMMFDAGLELENREVRRVEGFNTIANSLIESTIGYKEFTPYLKGEASLESVKESINRNSVRFIKKQITWFRRYGNALKYGEDNQLDLKIEKFLSEGEG